MGDIRMSWSYKLAKKKDIEGISRYMLVEAHHNDEGGIWGYTPHIDILQHIQHDDYDSDEEVKDSIVQTLCMVLSDTDGDVLDLDTFVPASHAFEDELEAIKSDN